VSTETIQPETAPPAPGPAAAWSPFDLTGRTAVVTGAGRGLGQGVALGLARAGADLVLLGLPGSQDDTARQVDGLGRGVEVLDLDVSDHDAVASVSAAALSLGPVDILVNNAGIIEREDTVDVTVESWNRVIDINLSGLFLLSQHLGRPMVERGAGKIVSIASLLAFQGGIRVISYTAAKHGVAGITKALANEWGPSGVQVNAIAPGYMATDNTTALREDADRARAILERIPAGRWGTPDDVAGAAVFLASPAADYVNGHVLVVDGGWMAR
jgi:2-deoxy-D-gluconate 3-dehydrogenase